MRQVVTGTEQVYALAKKYKIKTAFGTDILFSQGAGRTAGRAAGRSHPLVHARRGPDHGDVDERRVARSFRPPQPLSRQLGVIEEGALADLLLVDGNPLEDINLIKDPAKNFVVIMKDGTIYKNSLAPTVGKATR